MWHQKFQHQHFDLQWWFLDYFHHCVLLMVELTLWLNSLGKVVLKSRANDLSYLIEYTYLSYLDYCCHNCCKICKHTYGAKTLLLMFPCHWNEHDFGYDSPLIIFIWTNPLELTCHFHWKWHVQKCHNSLVGHWSLVPQPCYLKECFQIQLVHWGSFL